MIPLVGAVDSSRAHNLLETVLRGVERYQARVVLVDLTGVLLLDALVAQTLVKAITAARLLGARMLLIGIRPELAETFIHIDTDVDLSMIETSGTLQSGLLRALHITGVRVTALS
ncbi:STAS domain-containing protein [Chloroflexales bacterium ZM16-3]|nr:STAS domain-containing protein [Chloroflexales bacterium ZM16-3]